MDYLELHPDPSINLSSGVGVGGLRGRTIRRLTASGKEESCPPKWAVKRVPDSTDRRWVDPVIVRTPEGSRKTSTPSCWGWGEHPGRSGSAVRRLWQWLLTPESAWAGHRFRSRIPNAPTAWMLLTSARMERGLGFCQTRVTGRNGGQGSFMGQPFQTSATRARWRVFYRDPSGGFISAWQASRDGRGFVFAPAPARFDWGEVQIARGVEKPCCPFYGEGLSAGKVKTFQKRTSRFQGARYHEFHA